MKSVDFERFRIVASLLAAGSAVAIGVYATSRYGLGYGSDYVTYLAVARNLVDHGRFVSHLSLYTMWPPLYPTLQALGGLIGDDPMQAARWINIGSYGALVGLSTAALWRLVESRLVRGVGIAAVVVAFPLFTHAIKAGTEALFSTLVVAVLLIAVRCVRHSTWECWGGLAVLVGMAALQRYAGVALIATATLCALYRPGFLVGAWIRPARWKWKLAFGTAVASSAPLGMWLIRNFWHTGFLTGPRAIGADPSLWESVMALTQALSTWFVPPIFSPGVRAALLVGIVGLLIGLAGYARGSEDSTARSRGQEAVLLRVCGLFLVLYTALILTTGALGMSALPSRRLMAPAFVPALLLGLCVVDRTWSHVELPAGLSLQLVGAVLVWVVYQGLLTGSYAVVRHEIGAGGYHTEAWMASETVAWLQTHSVPEPTFSNDQHVTYFLGGVALREAPPNPAAERVASPGHHLKARSSYHVVCFDRPDRGRLHPRAVVQQALDLVPFVSESPVSVSALPVRWPDEACREYVPETASVDTIATRSDGRVLRVQEGEAMKSRP